VHAVSFKESRWRARSRSECGGVWLALCVGLGCIAAYPAPSLAQAPATPAPLASPTQPAGGTTTPPSVTEPLPSRGGHGETALAEPATAADSHAHDVTALSKQTQNPVADLVSLPFQFNFNNGGALRDQTQMVLNFQPVIPIHLGSKLNLITRPILPIISTPGSDGRRDRGLGDMQLQTYFAPAGKGALMWGVGPLISFPIATVPAFVTGSWGLGAGGLFVVTHGPFVVGALVNQVWNVKDNDGRPRVNAFSTQPFFNFNFGAGWAVGLAPTITASWDADKENTWTLPLGASITKTLVFDKQPMVIGVQYYRNVIRPDAAPANQLRLVLNFLFPGG
jgi:hypothetical protein